LYAGREDAFKVQTYTYMCMYSFLKLKCRALLVTREFS
jgi:hypothetical protein